MNIAFPALFILLLALPGFFFRQAFYSYKGGESLDSSNFSAQILYAIVLSTFFHAAGLYVVNDTLDRIASWPVLTKEDSRVPGFIRGISQNIADKDVDLRIVLALLTAPDKISESTKRNIAENVREIFFYFVSVCLSAYWLGRGFRVFVKWRKLDLSYDRLRYKNRWFYLLTGEELSANENILAHTLNRTLQLVILRKDRKFEKWKLLINNATQDKANESDQSKEFIELSAEISKLIKQENRLKRAMGLAENDRGKFDQYLKKQPLLLAVYISAVVTLGKDAYLYHGLFVDVEFTKTGQIDRILLTDAYRRMMSVDATQPGGEVESSERFYKIGGDVLVIAYKDIRTLNIQYHLEELSGLWEG